MKDVRSSLDRATSRRGFLQRAGFVGLAAGGATLASGMTFGTAFAQDQEEENGAGDRTLDIFNGALTAEQLAVTFYYNGLQTNAAIFGDVLSTDHIHYFQAALWEEHRHAQLFTAVGGSSLAGPAPKFFFPSDSFTVQHTFLAVLSALEDAFIGAYLAAVGDWSRNESRARETVPEGFKASQLAQIAAQIMGVEAEHRVLGRDVDNQKVPNNRILEEALFRSIGTVANHTGTAVGALLPFVTGGAGFSAMALPLPNDGQVIAAATSATIAALENDFPGGLAQP